MTDVQIIATIFWLSLPYIPNILLRNSTLSISPLINEEKLDSESQLESIIYVLNIYGKSSSDIKFLVGDNCPTNKKN